MREEEEEEARVHGTGQPCLQAAWLDVAQVVVITSSRQNPRVEAVVFASCITSNSKSLPRPGLIWSWCIQGLG